MLTFDKIIHCVIAALVVSIGLLSARHSSPTQKPAPVIVRYEPHDPPRFDQRISHLKIQNATFEQLISEISKAANISIICHATDVAAKVPRVTVDWTNIRLDTAVWIAFTVFDQDPDLVLADEKGRLVEGRAGYPPVTGPLVLYDFRSVHMTEGDTDPSSVTEHPWPGGLVNMSFTYSACWKAFGDIVGSHVTIHQGDDSDLARPYLISEDKIGCAVPMRSIMRTLIHSRSVDGNAEPMQFAGARPIKDLRLTNVSVGEALRQACEASHVNTVFTALPDGDFNAFISIDLHDVSLPQAISKIFDNSRDPLVSFSIREIDAVAVVCDDMDSIAQYPIVYDVRKIVQKPQAWYDPSNAPKVPNDDSVDKDDHYLLPGIALASLLGEKLAESSQDPGGAGVSYWRGRIIVKGTIRAHRAIEKMLAHISKTGRVEDESQ